MHPTGGGAVAPLAPPLAFSSSTNEVHIQLERSFKNGNGLATSVFCLLLTKRMKDWRKAVEWREERIYVAYRAYSTSRAEKRKMDL